MAIQPPRIQADEAMIAVVRQDLELLIPWLALTPDQFDEAVGDISGGDLLDLSRLLNTFCGGMGKWAGYFDARGGNITHKGALEIATRQHKAVRKALGFDITHDLSF